MNRICALLGLDFPLLQAGMGGVAGPRLAAAVSRAGCGGVVALYKQSPADIPALLSETCAQTSRPFGVNLIPEVAGERLLQGQVEALLECAPAGLFFTFFGVPGRDLCTRIRRAGHPLVVQIGTCRDALAAEARGADVLVVQGNEAGGHHLGSESRLDTLRRVRQLRLGLPLAASGGIGSGSDFARAISRGAEGCLCGTLFVAAEESAAHPLFKERVVSADIEDTVVTSLFDIGWPGRPHRVLRNETVKRGRELPATFIGRTRISGRTYPIPRFSAAAPTAETEGEVAQMAMYCGTSCRSVRQVLPVADLIDAFLKEAESAGWVARHDQGVERKDLHRRDGRHDLFHA